jgi:ribonuclease D
MQPITTTSELAAACSRMASHPFVTVDTEFLRETTYYPLLCVAQMASPEEAVVIDALAPGIDLAPFFSLMADEKVMKVFHAARQDIEIVWHRAKLIPHPIFDTQVAAMVLGYGDSISYDQLVQRITGDTLDKSHRFTDWTRRPLSEAQFSYAISDVTHLRDVYLALVDDLGRRGRVDWVQEEMHVLTSADTYRMDPGKRLAAAEDAGAQAQGACGAHRGRGLARARGAVARRAALARAQGRSDRRHRGAGADDDREAQEPALAAQGLRTLALGRGDRRGGERGLERDMKTLPRLRACNPSANGTAVVELLKVLLRMISERHHVAAKVIATVDDLERIAADDAADVPALTGWRRELFGEKALALKHGNLALAIEKGKVAAVEREYRQLCRKKMSAVAGAELSAQQRVHVSQQQHRVGHDKHPACRVHDVGQRSPQRDHESDERSRPCRRSAARAARSSRENV